MLAETQLIVGSSVIVGMLFGALLMQIAREAPFRSFREVLESKRATAAGIGTFLLFTSAWGGYVASETAVVFAYWALPFAWALAALGIVRYGMATDLLVHRGQQLVGDLQAEQDDEQQAEAAD